MWPKRRKNQKSYEAPPPADSNEANKTVGKHAGYIAARTVLVYAVESSTPPEAIAIDRLRIETLSRMSDELSRRMATNPTPTAAEKAMGTYVEGLEPQVRTATLMMREKGYQTAGSGFHHGNWRALGLDNPDHMLYPDERGQIMDFRQPFSLSGEVIELLGGVGAEVLGRPSAEGLVTRIGFSTPTPDLVAIEARWNSIADILPDTGMPAPPIDEAVAATAFYVNSEDIGISRDQLAASPMAVGAIQLGGSAGSSA